MTSDKFQLLLSAGAALGRPTVLHGSPTEAVFVRLQHLQAEKNSLKKSNKSFSAAVKTQLSAHV